MGVVWGGRRGHVRGMQPIGNRVTGRAWVRRVVGLWVSAGVVGLAWADGTRLRVMTPVEWQVVQRERVAGGTIPVAGVVEGEVGMVEARLTGTGLDGRWERLAVDAGGKIGGGMTAPAGGWYRLELRVLAEGRVTAQAVVERVGLGEVFVVAGQSNSANHGEERQRTESGLVATFNGTGWQVADDPQPGAGGSGGSFMPAFGDRMAWRFGVPVGLVAVGAGGTSVREWLPAGGRFPNPPTVLSNVRRVGEGEWESLGGLYANLTARVRSLGRQGCRAVLWHQGESDANQADPTRTLAGALYGEYLSRVIRGVRADAGWDVPWFVAQASYHGPTDTGSEDIRAAQAGLWKAGLAFEGPDTDQLGSAWRDGGGKGVHFSGAGLREHGWRWAEKVGGWLQGRLAGSVTWPGLKLPGTENFEVGGRKAFLYPAAARWTNGQPWVLYGPTLPPLPDEAERWMHERFVAAGVAVAGVDVGEAYGSPGSHAAFDALYAAMRRRGHAARVCLLGRSRGGLLVTSWGTERTDRVSGVAGIYPVFDLRSYPGLEKAAPAYGVDVAGLEAGLGRLNPIARMGALARARVPAYLVHGDRDTLVPLEPNSGAFVRQYAEAGAGDLVTLEVLRGQGHNMYEGFFRSASLVDFVIRQAWAGR